MSIELMKSNIASIANRHGLELVVLFGSTARGKTDKFSDIDIAIRSKKSISYTTQAQIEYEICKTFNRGDVEVVNLRDANPLLLKFIAQDGRILYELSPGMFDEFQIYAMHTYFETQPLIRLGEAQLREHLKSYA